MPQPTIQEIKYLKALLAEALEANSLKGISSIEFVPFFVLTNTTYKN